MFIPQVISRTEAIISRRLAFDAVALIVSPVLIGIGESKICKDDCMGTRAVLISAYPVALLYKVTVTDALLDASTFAILIPLTILVPVTDVNIVVSFVSVSFVP